MQELAALVSSDAEHLHAPATTAVGEGPAARSSRGPEAACRFERAHRAARIAATGTRLLGSSPGARSEGSQRLVWRMSTVVPTGAGCVPPRRHPKPGMAVAS